MSRWMVYKIAGIWQARDPEIDRTKIFFDWEDAIHYANAKARTVEVTLPRTAHQNTGQMRTTPSTDGLLIEFFIGGKWETMRVPKHELDPLALALLTQHYRKEEQ